ncbi:MAG: hypothetical protein ABI688_00265 [Bacteroidota bacterium]
MNDKTTPEGLTTLVACLADAAKDGYTANFTVTEKGLSEVAGSRFYTPEEIKVDNFYRFEGASDPADSAILYVIKTKNGKKGTLTDAYGVDANPLITEFMDQVTKMEKKT